MRAPDPDRIEELLAAALAAHDGGGDDALQRFLAAHAADRPAIERGLARCRQLGMLGPAATRPTFPERLGEFRLLRQLGSGGMGVVYEAEQESLGRRVALKLVRPELLYFEGARERFRREVEAVARLSHPGVVRILASGEQGDLPWYAMELLAGRTVQELCQALAGRDPATLGSDDLRRVVGGGRGDGTDPLPGPWWQVCVRLMHAAVVAAHHVHLRGIVHRDIKPSNVMLTTDGRTVLLDFGVARLRGSREFTRSGQTPGSPAYMSPEQLRGEAVDERTDVYSLAATLWQLLTLRPPFDDARSGQPLRDGNAPRLRAHHREVPHDLALVVQQAMDHDRERRYADAGAFAEDLDAVLQRRPIRARGVGLPLRAFRWCQRHRVAATGLAAALLFTLALPGVFAWRERGVNRALGAAVADARASLDTTLDAIYAFLVTVSDERLRHVPTAEAHTRELLRDACAMYRDLLARHPDDQRLRGNAAEALDHYALRLAQVGDRAGAERLLREVVQRLGGDGADTAAALHKRALARIHLGDLHLHAGQAGAADAAFAAAERDLQLAATDAGLDRERTRLCIELGTKRAGGRDPQLEVDRLTEECRATIALCRANVARPGATASDRRQLVSALDLLGTAMAKNDRTDEALPVLEEALAIARAIPADASLWPPQPQLLADVLLTLGNTLVQRRDLGAVPLLKECLALREAAAREQPRDLRLRCELAAALHALAHLNFHQAQDQLLLERLERAIELQRSVVAELPWYARARDYLRNHLTLRGSCLARIGDPAALHRDLRELAAMQQDPAAQRTAARLWLRLAGWQTPGTATAGLPERQACLDAALACLLAADRLGFGPRDPLGEALYAPLRHRPEFEALRARVAARRGAPQTAVSPPSTSRASREMPR